MDLIDFSQQVYYSMKTNGLKPALYMALYFSTIWVTLACVSIVSANEEPEIDTSLTIIVQDKKLVAYRKSIALLIAVSKYTNGWRKLYSVPGEIDLVEAALRAKGYEIVRVDNPNSDQLLNAYSNFIKAYGYDKENRLLFFYSGHGHTMDDNRKGYLVPTDAAHPDDDPLAFKQKALDMNQLLSWARQMDAKHGLFLFDSCFSGIIFKQKNALSKKIATISRWTDRPVRQFITSGGAGETVPAKSSFTPAFIDGINGMADMNNDGFVLGTELGLYLQAEVGKFTKQTPQYGKINDYELSRGDFVFLSSNKRNRADLESKINNQLDLELPVFEDDDDFFTEDLPSSNVDLFSMNKPHKVWYKNPWYWVATFATIGGAVYQLNKNNSDTSVVIFE